MREYEFVTVDVFTERRFGGNPLAVFPDAQGLSDAEMQALTAEFNLSETTFVLPPRDPQHTARVRIFNRTAELAFAGHPNVGTGYVLAQQGRDANGVLRFEELAGLVEVRIERDGTAVRGAMIETPQPLSLGLTLAPATIARCAGLSRDDVRTDTHPPTVATVGNPFVLVEVSPAALARATPDLAAFRSARRRARGSGDGQRRDAARGPAAVARHGPEHGVRHHPRRRDGTSQPAPRHRAPDPRRYPRHRPRGVRAGAARQSHGVRSALRRACRGTTPRVSRKRGGRLCPQKFPPLSLPC